MASTKGVIAIDVAPTRELFGVARITTLFFAWIESNVFQNDHFAIPQGFDFGFRIGPNGIGRECDWLAQELR